jgi:Flp pilus assembly protein CpaB
VKRTNRLLVLVGIFLAVVAAIGVIAVGGSGGGGDQNAKGTPTPTPEPTVTVVIAKTDMALGDKITTDMVDVETMTVSQQAALGHETYSATSQVVGEIAGGAITKGSVLFVGTSFLQPGVVVKGQDLASAIAPGKVAVTMEVDQVNGVGTLVVPGDHVDIILSVWMDQLHISTTGASTNWTVELPGSSQVTTKMIIQNCKVLATLLPTTESTQNDNQNNGSSPTPQAEATADVVTASDTHMIVMVEVQPDEAEIIRWAQREEKTDPQNYITLGLALRSDKDNDAPPVTTPGITFKQLVTLYGVLPLDPRAVLPADLAKQISW